MIIFVYGPKLSKERYVEIHRELIGSLIRPTVDARGFDRKDVRMFFPLLAHNPDTVEVAIFAGSEMSTTIRETRVWKNKIEDVIARFFPSHVINGFVSKLDPTAQFYSVYALNKKKSA